GMEDAAAQGASDDADGLEHDLLRLRALLGGGGPRGLQGRADGAPRGAVAQATLLVLLDPLHGGSRVGHGCLPPLRWSRINLRQSLRAWSPAARPPSDCRPYRPRPSLPSTMSA